MRRALVVCAGVLGVLLLGSVAKPTTQEGRRVSCPHFPGSKPALPEEALKGLEDLGYH